ncbi:MaoC-like hydratase/dehydratase [Castellaniella defragrans 65Phen]|jgi:acyl dehydratase|uniref:MaoC-like hydratase/dehydratase n=2 Tax=Castellaniella defragrans TaxID=75697 RepID=W8WZQ3_CASD6|nr:MaoC/PaaZ C-terminal domain-containing protein [Castellaniella defragrans]MBB6085281.1 acyl dehydratase [Castellaniella defragrans]CDM25248.1 MaoC-like hydratase/dehydratase [Castellaniella defragrans 65Phen]
MAVVDGGGTAAVRMPEAVSGPAVLHEAGAAFSPEDLRRYAQASGDHNPLHLDPAFARRAGFDGLVVHGMLNMARLGRMLTRHFDAGSIRGFGARFESVLLVGQATTIGMSLTGYEGGVARVALLMRAQDGRRIVSGHADVRLSEEELLRRFRPALHSPVES